MIGVFGIAKAFSLVGCHLKSQRSLLSSDDRTIRRRVRQARRKGRERRGQNEPPPLSRNSPQTTVTSVMSVTPVRKVLA
jgi:hypothetical protein